MASGKKSFILYSDYIDLFDDLTDEEAGKLMKHLLRYVNDLNPEPPDRMTGLLFTPIKKQLKRDLLSWEEKRVVKAESGRIGGIKSGETRRKQKEANEANASKTQANEGVSCKLLVVTENVNKDKTNTANFSPECEPSLILLDEFYPFEEFWTDYDKKVGDKTKLSKKWAKISNIARKLVKEYLPLYKESQPDKQFRKDPDTFLNNKSWNDEIIFKNKTNGPNFKQQSQADQTSIEQAEQLLREASPFM